MSRVVLRCGTAAGVGAAVVLLWWSVATLFPGLLRPSADTPADCSGLLQCSGASVLDVFVDLLVAITLVLVSGMLLAWLGLWSLRVRPAWPVALLGPVGALAVPAVAPGLVRSLHGDGPWDFLLAVPLGYALAAAVTATEIPLRWRLGIVTAAVVAAVVQTV